MLFACHLKQKSARTEIYFFTLSALLSNIVNYYNTHIYTIKRHNYDSFIPYA